MALPLLLDKEVPENKDSAAFSIAVLPDIESQRGDSIKQFEVIRKEVKVLPTISDKEFYVYNPKDEAISCCILSIQGQIIAEKVLTNTGKNKLDISVNQHGMYILIFKDIHGAFLGKQKVIKQ